MKYLPCLVFILFISCQGKVEESVIDFFFKRQFSLDTVHIDSGNEIIFLRHQLLNADISKDGKYFYNFNENDISVEKINLDELHLEEKLPFERDGPNGIGAGVMMKVHDENQFTMNGMFQSSLFSLDGEKLMTVYFESFSLGGHPREGGSN